MSEKTNKGFLVGYCIGVLITMFVISFLTNQTHAIFIGFVSMLAFPLLDLIRERFLD